MAAVTSLVKTSLRQLDGAQPVDQDKAVLHYAMMLNQTRRSIDLVLPRECTWIAFNPKMKCKLAVLVVMTKKAFLTLHDIELLLKYFEYKKTRSTIRRALQRIVKFGLAEESRSYGRRRPKCWRMTERGYQFINSPQALQMTWD